MPQSWSRSRSAVAALVLSVLFLAGCAEADTIDADDAAAVASVETPTPVPSAETTAPPQAEPSEKTEATEDSHDREQSDAAAGSALQMLYGLDVKGRAPKTGYDRDLFGWRDDVDRNGCDTRNDVLRRDLKNITLKSGGCVVLGGSLTSDFTGDTFDFIRGSGNNIDIDHVVALSNAWQTGAQQLSDSQRKAFSNDPVNLLAVESSVNRSKGDGDAATWLPPRKGYRCEYVARQIQVKHDYDLWVTSPEFDAMEKLLLNCDQDEFGDDGWPGRGNGDVTSQQVAEPEPKKEPKKTQKKEPKPQSESAGDSSSGGSVYYKNCTAAREAGAAPVHRSDPGYGTHLDRDNDGIGCE